MNEGQRRMNGEVRELDWSLKKKKEFGFYAESSNTITFLLSTY